MHVSGSMAASIGYSSAGEEVLRYGGDGEEASTTAGVTKAMAATRAVILLADGEKNTAAFEGPL